MAQIAAGAGLQQSSLYYYFRSKEEILAAIVAKANVVPLELVRRVRDQPLAPAVRLWRFVAGDVAALCALPFDINEVHRYRGTRPPALRRLLGERRTLQPARGYRPRGGAGGALREVDPGSRRSRSCPTTRRCRTGSATTPPDPRPGAIGATWPTSRSAGCCATTR